MRGCAICNVCLSDLGLGLVSVKTLFPVSFADFVLDYCGEK